MSSPSDAQQPIRLLLWLSFVNARRAALDRELLLHPRPPAPEGGAGARPGRGGRADPGARQPHRRACRCSTPAAGFYEELLEAGVRIFEYQASMMHAKTVVVDDAWALVGSANMDERSMEINEENLLGIAEAEFAGVGGRGHRGGLQPRRRRSAREPGAGDRCYRRALEKAREGADRAVLRRSPEPLSSLSPPAIAATTVISSPSLHRRREAAPEPDVLVVQIERDEGIRAAGRRPAGGARAGESGRRLGDDVAERGAVGLDGWTGRRPAWRARWAG